MCGFCWVAVASSGSSHPIRRGREGLGCQGHLCGTKCNCIWSLGGPQIRGVGQVWCVGSRQSWLHRYLEMREQVGTSHRCNSAHHPRPLSKYTCPRVLAWLCPKTRRLLVASDQARSARGALLSQREGEEGGLHCCCWHLGSLYPSICATGQFGPPPRCKRARVPR